MILFAIDPGVNGACCIFMDRKLIEVFNMPTMIDGKKNKKQINSAYLANQIKKNIEDIDKNEINVIIEKVSAMPGQGVTSMFNFGQSFGVIKGIFSTLEIPIHYVRPAKWKKHFNLIGSEKDASRTKAIELFPNYSSEISKKKDANKADAILIGKYFLDHYESGGFHG